MELPTPDRIRDLLAPHVEAGFATQQQHYSKEEIRSLGVRTKQVRAIAQETFADLKPLSGPDLLDHCEAFLPLRTIELTTVALDWAFRGRRKFVAGDFERFYTWLCAFVHNWSDCNHLCTKVYGDHLMRFPENLPEVLKWSGHENRWVRRAAAVILIPGLRKDGRFFTELLQISVALLEDEDDLVQKGYGWALKVASKHHAEAVLEFVVAQKAVMPRTALRYAIEKLSQEAKAIAMA
ncbi:MAG: DNA alkylation repair protein [Bacteroidota bacterium]